MTNFNLYHKRTHLSISSLCAFARCPRMFFYSSGCGLSNGDHPALAFGSGIHAALPHAFHGDLSKASQAFVKCFGDTPMDEKRNPLSATAILEDYKTSHENSRSIYVLRQPPSNAIRLDDQVSDWEVPFALDIGLDVPLVGRIDALCTHRDTGEPWCLEWKTTSELSTRFLDGFTINPQVYGYALAARSYGINVRGTIVEGIRVAAPLKKSKVQHVETLAQPIFISQHHLDDFLTWARWIGSQILECEKREEFPKDISACVPYPQFGQAGYQCKYQNLCLVQDWTSIASMFEVREPRPFKISEE